MQVVGAAGGRTDPGDGAGRRQRIRSASACADWACSGMEERVRHLGGTFQIDSRPGRGTLLRVTLPLERPMPWPGADPEPRPKTSRTGFERSAHDGLRFASCWLTITISCATACAFCWNGSPDSWWWAKPPTDARRVQLAQNESPDVVIMDIAMPNMNGIEATRRIVEKHPKIGVVILSMHHDESYVIRSLKAGAQGLSAEGCAQDRAHRGHPRGGGRALLLQSQGQPDSAGRLHPGARDAKTPTIAMNCSPAASARFCKWSPKAKPTRKWRTR